MRYAQTVISSAEHALALEKQTAPIAQDPPPRQCTTVLSLEIAHATAEHTTTQRLMLVTLAMLNAKSALARQIFNA
jgi:hypothetical protein